MKLRLFLPLIYIVTHQWAYGWGYTAHRLINREAVKLLNSPLGEFFSGYINYISEHAVDPDLWKKDKENHPNEYPGHFIDADLFDDYPFKKIPRKWEDVVNKYGKKKLDSWGTAPWRIEEYYYQLVTQFRDGEWIKARLTATALGHYVSDIHVPFHTCENYNGQLTGNKGVHKRWEANMVEEFLLDAMNTSGSLISFDDPVSQAFLIVEESFPYVSTILTAETKARETVPVHLRSTISDWEVSMFGSEYIKVLYVETGALAVSRMEMASLRVASYWHSAWVAAGKPSPPTR